MSAINSLVLLMYMAILLVGIAQKLRIPYPIVLVLGGALFGFIPDITLMNIDPNVLLLIVLPPILFYASYSLSFKEFILYYKDIISVAVGLVLATTVVVAILFKWLFPELTWGLAFAFGALISPPDAVAVSSTLKRFSISSRLRTILEGESLVNDAMALVIYKFAVLAILTGTFSIHAAGVQFFYVAFGGIAIGLILGYVLHTISSYMDPVLAVVCSFVIPYATFCIADAMATSGVLAVVSCGLLGSRMLLTDFNPLTRVLGWASWDILIILLNCFIFIMIGLEFRQIIETMPFYEIWQLAGSGVLITLAIIATRYLWIFIRRGWWHYRARKSPVLRQQSKIYMLHAIIGGWAGMRGIVSLTAALALPILLPDGVPLEGRNIVLFLTFEVIFLTLVLPGLTLPWLIRRLHLKPVEQTSAMLQARKKLASIATHEIERLHAMQRFGDEDKDVLDKYFHSRHRILEIISVSEEDTIEQVRHHILQRQREHLMLLWIQNEVDHTTMSHLERELDIEESHLARGEI